jgi:hypothetical protein
MDNLPFWSGVYGARDMACAKPPACVLQNYDGHVRQVQMGFNWCAADRDDGVEGQPAEIPLFRKP